METLEKYFEKFRNNIIGINAEFESPYGIQKMLYADWIASGRLYKPIEEKMINLFGPMVGNTHSESSETGQVMTNAYKMALKSIKEHVNASEKDVIITTGSGMTGAINKFQRILGLKASDSFQKLYNNIPENNNMRPVVFITHMEHHSNQTSWLETIADVVVIEPDDNLYVNPDYLRYELKKYAHRPLKIGSFSACSNVTGIEPPYYELAKAMHEVGGYCFIDFAASAPYVKIDMHPSDDPLKSLDAIFFSPHKFLGGPGSTGVLIFNSELYNNKTPDQPGGGTVTWTNPWGDYQYFDDIEVREDGGTPAFLQAFRIALSINLKEMMGVKQMHDREKELLDIVYKEMPKIKGLNILAGDFTERLGIISFYIDDVHHNLVVRLMNDRFGIQVRGGCSCAGTYGHYLLHVDYIKSKAITDQISGGDFSEKPGWIRLSLHPTMTNAELYFVIDALKQITLNLNTWKNDYVFDNKCGEFFHKNFHIKTVNDYKNWIDL